MASTKLREEVMTAALLLQKEQGVTGKEIREKFLPNLSDSGIRSALRDLEIEGFLIVKDAQTRTSKAAKYYLPGKKEFKFTERQDAQPAMPPRPPATKPEAPAPLDDNLAMWAEKLNSLISLLAELKELTPTVLAGLLDLSRDIERLARVKTALQGLNNIARRNI